MTCFSRSIGSERGNDAKLIVVVPPPLRAGPLPVPPFEPMVPSNCSGGGALAAPVAVDVVRSAVVAAVERREIFSIVVAVWLLRAALLFVEVVTNAVDVGTTATTEAALGVAAAVVVIVTDGVVDDGDGDDVDMVADDIGCLKRRRTRV